MAKRSNQKLKLLYLYRILLSSTDESGGLTLSELSEELYKYGVRAERKTLYDDLEALKLFGLDVKVRRDRRVRYYVGNRDISAGALKLIADILNSSTIISDKEADAILQSLGDLSGKSALLLSPREKNDAAAETRNGALGAIELFCRAILSNTRMRGRYFCWNEKKQRIMQYEGRIIEFSPWYIDLSGNTPTVILTISGSEKPVALRADRFVDLALTNAGRLGEDRFLRLKSDGEIDKLLGRIAPIMIRMRAENSFANQVIDRFGVAITVTNSKETSFEFSAKAAPDESFYSWIFASRGRVELLSPQSVLDEYRDICKSAQPKDDGAV